MRNGQTKPGYNLQVGTENQFITDFGLFPNPTDTLTMPAFLTSFGDRYAQGGVRRLGLRQGHLLPGEPALQQGEGLLRLPDGAAHGARRHRRHEDGRRLRRPVRRVQGCTLRGMPAALGVPQGQGLRKDHNGQPYGLFSASWEASAHK